MSKANTSVKIDRCDYSPLLLIQMDKKLTILTVGDPHFKVSNVQDSTQMTLALLKLATELKPTLIVVLGDVLDRHETIHVTPLTQACKMLKQLAEIAQTYVLIGNHDRPNNSDFLSEQHPFTALKGWPNLTIVDKVIDASCIYHGQTLTFVPYVPPGRFLEALNSNGTAWKQSMVIFAHQEFKGAQMGAIKSTEGDEWPLDHPYVISGHIHDYHQLQTNVLYTGTPMQHAFGDRDDKTVTLVTIDGEVSHKQISLGLPKRFIVHLKPSQIELYEPPTGCMIKIVVNGTMAELKTVAKLDRIKQLIKLGIKVVYKETAETLSQPIVKNDVSFVNTLYSVTKDDPDLSALVKELFGDLKPKSTLKMIIKE